MLYFPEVSMCIQTLHALLGLQRTRENATQGFHFTSKNVALVAVFHDFGVLWAFLDHLIQLLKGGIPKRPLSDSVI